MTAQVPTTEPTQLRVGLTWQWRREDLTDYPASLWTLTYWFKQLSAAGAKFSVVAAADADNFAIAVAAATTAGYTADDYSWVAVVSSGAESFEVDKGSTKLLPKYNSDVALDDRSHARKVLESIEAVIEGRATKDQEEYTIGTRSLKRTPLADLQELRRQYRSEVYAETQRERASNGKKTGAVVVKL